ARVQRGNQSRKVFGIPQQSGHVAHEYQSARFDRDRSLRGGDIRVAIVNLSIFATRRWADHGRHAPFDALADGFEVYACNLANEAQVKVALSTCENLRARKAFGLPAKFGDHTHDLRIDLARQNSLNHLHRGVVSIALTLHKLGFQPGSLHGARDRFAAAVDHYGIDADRFQKHNNARDTGTYR